MNRTSKCLTCLWLAAFTVTAFAAEKSDETIKLFTGQTHDITVSACEQGEQSPASVRNPALNPVQFNATPNHAPVELVRNGIPQASIILPDNANENTSQGHRLWQRARELRNLIAKSTGAELKIDVAMNATATNAIYIGFHSKEEELPEQGFRIQTHPHQVQITANPDDLQGLSFAICDFAERFLGVRWYYPGEDGTIFPERKNLLIPPVHYTDYPRMISRRMYPSPPDGLSKYWRLGGSVNTLGPGACHSWCNYAMHKDQYPECFELQMVNGNR